MIVDLSVDEWMQIQQCISSEISRLDALYKRFLAGLKPDDTPVAEVVPERTVVLKPEPQRGPKKGGRVGRRPNWMISEGLGWDDVVRLPDGRLEKKGSAEDKVAVEKPSVPSLGLSERHCVRALALNGSKPIHIADLCTAIAAQNPGMKVQIKPIEDILKSNPDKFESSNSHYWTMKR